MFLYQPFEGVEPVIIYYPFGSLMPDRQHNKSNLTSSEAFNFKLEPYDRFSIKKVDETLKGLKLPSSLLYHVQEQIIDTYGNRQSVKRGGRILLSCLYPKTEKIDSVDSTNGKIAFIDFEIGKNGVPSTVNPTGELNNEIPINSISNSLGIALEFNGKNGLTRLKSRVNIIPSQSSVSFWVNVGEQEIPTDQYLLRFTTIPKVQNDPLFYYKVQLTNERKIKSVISSAFALWVSSLPNPEVAVILALSYPLVSLEN